MVSKGRGREGRGGDSSVGDGVEEEERSWIGEGIGEWIEGGVGRDGVV